MSYMKKPKTINPDEVDPSVYYYDEVYDEMKDDEKSKIAEQRTSNKDRDRQSKYIQGLKETAEERKTDKEIRKFKKYTRDRDETNKDLSNEDVYITSAYKKKLREIEELESKRRRRIEEEKDNSMNFIRHNSSRRETGQTTQDEKKPSKEEENTPCSIPAPSTSKGCQLKTLEERRVYLRGILAKRTVGKVYDEAVQRYIKRKAQLQQQG